MIEGSLWSAKASHALVGEDEAYWTHFVILAPGASIAPLEEDPEYIDLYAAEVALSNVPVFALGLLRSQHLTGLTKRPQGPLPDAFDEVSDRPDIMPSPASLEATLALDPRQSVTMVNFLEYFPDEKGDKKTGRQTYRRYGTEAMKAVHAVGGQLLFAGTVTRVLAEPKGISTNGEWDDLAAMIYPDPGAIFSMEQNEAYVASLGYRDSSLKRTHVIASLAN